MAILLRRLAEMTGGVLVGDPDTEIHAAATLGDATSGDITLVDRVDKVPLLAASRASAAIVPVGSEQLAKPAILVENVHEAFIKAITHFQPPRQATRIGVHPASIVSRDAVLCDNVDIHPGATVAEDVVIGANSTIHAGVHVMPGVRIGRDVTLLPGVVLYENVEIGDRVLIHAGAVIGAYGFGYSLQEGKHQRGGQFGNVVIGADVEIGANTTIDRGTYGPTRIGEGTKIDNLVMIAHNCQLGKHNMICSQVGIAGSCTVGDYVVMAGQVGIRDHVTIGDRAILGAMAGVINDVPADSLMLGVPATEGRDQKLKQAAFSKLPEMRKDLKKIKRLLDELTDSANQTKPQAA